MPSWASPSSGPAGKFAKLNTAIGEARLASRVRNMLGVKEDPNVKVGINGFGVMGRLVCKACQEIEGIDVVAINDPYVDVEYMAYQLQHPGLATGAWAAGPYQGEIVAENEQLMLDGRPVTVMSEPEPDKIEWVSTGAKYVVDCTGAFNTMRKASGHFKGGAQKVIVAGACGEAPQYVMGANHKTYKNETLVSAGTPANHCLALLVKAIDEAAAASSSDGGGGIEHCCATILHASRKLELEKVDAGPSGKGSADWRSGRGEGIDVIPTVSEAAEMLPRLLPTLAGKVSGMCFRVPAGCESARVSCVDLTVSLNEPGMELGKLRNALRDAASSHALRGKLGYRDDDVSAADFVGDSRSCIVDGAASLQSSPTLLKLVAWYQVEWPYARRLVELLLHMQAVDHGVVADGLL
jgi:glyceraldehyde 3-phosphate dehydrogenase